MKHFVIRRRMACRTLLFLGALAAIGGGAAFANPYLAKSGDTPVATTESEPRVGPRYVSAVSAFSSRKTVVCGLSGSLSMPKSRS